jgi:hypothetical protein
VVGKHSDSRLGCRQRACRRSPGRPRRPEHAPASAHPDPGPPGLDRNVHRSRDHPRARKVRGPGDLLLRWAGQEVFLEIVTFGPDENNETEKGHHDRHFLHLLSLRPDAPIYWEGDIPGLLNRTDEAAWIQATAEAAVRCAQTGEPIDIPSCNGACLTVRPGAAPPNTSTKGPYLESDDGSRLARKIDQKGAQTRGAGLAWVWVEDYGGIHPLSDFNSMPIDAKLQALADLAAPVLATRLHVAGIGWSAAQWSSSAPPDAQAQAVSGFAVQRTLPIDRVRQSIILNRRLILPDQTARVLQLCDAEPRWCRRSCNSRFWGLDWALARLGVVGGANSLLTQSPLVPKSRLWTPPRAENTIADASLIVVRNL